MIFGKYYQEDSGHYSESFQSWSGTYGINSKFYAPVEQNVTASVVGGIKFTKVNRNGEPLSGAVYQLLDADGNPAADADNNPVANQTTDTNGVAQWDNLPAGDYQIKEVEAPAGYAVNPDAVPVTVTANVAFENELTGGEKNININAETDTFVPDEETFVGNGCSLIPQTPTTPLTAGANATYISNGGAEITTLQNEIAATDADKASVRTANLTLSMNGAESNPSSLANAKEAINARITGRNLNEKDSISH